MKYSPPSKQTAKCKSSKHAGTNHNMKAKTQFKRRNGNGNDFEYYCRECNAHKPESAFWKSAIRMHRMRCSCCANALKRKQRENGIAKIQYLLYYHLRRQKKYRAASSLESCDIKEILRRCNVALDDAKAGNIRIVPKSKERDCLDLQDYTVRFVDRPNRPDLKAVVSQRKTRN